MDHQNNPNQDHEAWLDEILGKPDTTQEIGPDEQAVSSAGLTHPDKLDLENILAEDWDSVEPEEAALPEDLPIQENPEEVTPEETVQDVPAIAEVPLPAEPEVLEPEEPVQELKKRRPKMKKGYGLFGIPHILATVIWLAIIVAIGVSLGRTIWLCCADLMAFGKGSQEITITITESDTLDSVADKLSKASLIRYPGLFKTFAELTGKEERISVGTFTLNTHLDYNAMINAMGYNAPSREDVDVMFPEGSNCAQIFRILEENNVCSVEDLEEWAANGELDDYWFLEGVERGDRYCLEGYLAPDTYTFYTNDEPQRVLEKFLDEFDDRFTDLMREDLTLLQQRHAEKLAANGYSQEYIDANPLTLHSVVTLASIVQRETSSDSESFDIASVFYNRLADPDNYPFLGSDATVYYAIGDYFREKEELTTEDLETPSPYNTRISKGLPPGPICNPDPYTMYAALDPNETDYHYFVFDKEQQKHRFSTNYEKHMAIVAELGL